jgi:hypothetical protein
VGNLEIEIAVLWRNDFVDFEKSDRSFVGASNNMEKSRAG